MEMFYSYLKRILKIINSTMMIFMVTIMVCFLLTSCDNRPNFIAEKNSSYLKNLNFAIEKASIIPWEVGIPNKVTLSKGFVVTLNHPYLEPSVIQELQNRFGVDSWLLRITRSQAMGRDEVLGYIFLPFYNKGRSLFFGLFYEYQKIIVKILYSAIFVDPNSGKSVCPIGDHDKEIPEEDFSFSNKGTPFEISLIEDKAFTDQVISPSKSGFQAIEINGGYSEIGHYVFEYALYNSSSKYLYSDFLAGDNFVEIGYERTQIVTGCSNYKPKEKKKIEFRWESLHIK